MSKSLVKAKYSYCSLNWVSLTTWKTTEVFEHSPSEFYHPDENFDERSIKASRIILSENQEEIQGLINNQKSANTTKKTTTDMNTLSRYMKTIGMSESVESLPASELDHLLCKFFMNIRKKDGEEYEPDTISGFQRSIQRYLSEKGSSVNISWRTRTLKSRGKFSLRNASHFFMNTVKVTNRKLPRHSKTMKKMLSLRQENLVIQIQFRCSERFGGSCLSSLRFPGERRKPKAALGRCSAPRK